MGAGGSVVGTGGKSAGGAGGGSVVGTGGAAGATGQDNPVCSIADPSLFQANTSIGHGGTNYKESPHFLLFGASNPDPVLKFMEAAQKCFVEDWCWRSPSLSITSDDGKHTKFNIYTLTGMSAGGLMQYDQRAGLAFIEVLAGQEGYPRVTVHEYGHSLTLAAKGWVDQGNKRFSVCAAD